jgi:hypothetical protein
MGHIVLGQSSMQCVQRFDDSRISFGLAFHITYRSLQRSSSNGVPRDPMLPVVLTLINLDRWTASVDRSYKSALPRTAS